MIIRRHPAWISAGIGDEIVMLNADTDASIGLTRVGARIWALLENPMSPEALQAQLLRLFDVTPALCRREVASFLEDLAGHGAIIHEPEEDA